MSVTQENARNATRPSAETRPIHGIWSPVLVPVDADLVFDIRCLPNPYWQEALRPYSGLDGPVIEFLSRQPEVNEMFEDIAAFVSRWVPRFQADNRSYMTIAVGCTGGRHRSVYMAERLGEQFKETFGTVLVRHRETVA